jgi:Holliday junction resolvase
MPDVYAIWESMPLWIELKVIKGNVVRLSPQQVAWHTSHSHVGGLSFILVKQSKDRDLFLFEGRTARSVASDGVSYAEGFRTKVLDEVFDEMKRISIEHWTEVLRPCGPAS